MNSRHAPTISLVILLLGFPSFELRAEDWTTTDGKVYRDVKVVEFAPDALGIICKDGGALVPLADLPPEIQKRFGYDPARAKIAADQRAATEAADKKALDAENDRLKKVHQEIVAAENARLKAMSSSSSRWLDPAILEPENHTTDSILGPPNGVVHHHMTDAFQTGITGQPSPVQTTDVPVPKATKEAQDAAASSALTAQLAASKIRLIGKVRSVEGSGYILRGLSGSDNYVIHLDQARPDHQVVNDLGHGGPVFLDTPDSSRSENNILDVDAYPAGTYTAISGESMPCFTTRVSYARTYLQVKQHL